MDKNKNSSRDDLKHVHFDIEKIRKDAGKRSDSNKNTIQSGIVKSNEVFGTSMEHFTKKKDSKKSPEKDE